MLGYVSVSRIVDVGLSIKGSFWSFVPISERKEVSLGFFLSITAWLLLVLSIETIFRAVCTQRCMKYFLQKGGKKVFIDNPSQNASEKRLKCEDTQRMIEKIIYRSV